MSRLERDEVVFPDGDEGRIYFPAKHDDLAEAIAADAPLYPSVTTVTNRREDPGKAAAIRGWKRKNDGTDGRPNHEHLWQYSGPRGTFIHWYCLSQLTDEEIAGHEEEAALEWVEDHSKNYPYVYSITTNHAGTLKGSLPEPAHYYEWFGTDDAEAADTVLEEKPLTLKDILMQDASWALSEGFTSVLPELGLAAQTFEESSCKTVETYFTRDVRTANVRSVETYVRDHEDHYGGQFDLLYDKPDGTTVLCDLKTSSVVGWSHKAQSAAYANALDVDVDELCVVRLQPDKRETEVSWEGEWAESRDELYEEFAEVSEDVRELVRELVAGDH